MPGFVFTGIDALGRLLLIAALVLLISVSAAAPASGQSADLKFLLKSAQTWMYQLQDLYEPEAVAALARTEYQLLVLEPGQNFKEYPYDTAGMVAALRRTPSGRRRALLAYVDIGEAEDYRDYWKPGWRAPTRSRPGRPDFMITVDPDGWSGNFPVAFWRPEWKKIWLGSSGIIARLASLGFDGVFLDWVEAYDDDYVMAAAEKEGLDPALEMIRFIEEIGRAGRRVRPGFLVVPQNAIYLIDHAPKRYAASIDALAVEDTWFSGLGDADWNDPGAGDRPNLDQEDWSTQARLKQYRVFQSLGLPVFSVDYCRSRKNAALVYRRARSAGLRPLVTRVSLSRTTTTPPWDFK